MVANFTATPIVGVAPLPVQFTDLSTDNPDSWYWTFGDNSSSNSQNPLHVYNTPGTYTVSLTVSSMFGSDDETKVNYIVVSSPPPVAEFSGTPLDDEYPLLVSFTDLSTSLFTINNWLWDFGDGHTSTSQNPSHSYNAPGYYTVSLTVTNSYNVSDTETKINYVRARDINLVVDFVGVPREGDSPLVVDFTNLTSIPVGHSLISLLWDFGDGATSTEENPTHVYLYAGLFTVTLKVFVTL